MNSHPLAGKVGIVTGAGRGIGRVEALELARAGCKVVVADFGLHEGKPTAQRVASEICSAGGEAVGFCADLMQADNAAALIELAISEYGRLDILVNNAGLRGGNPVHKLTEEQWDQVLGSHLKASFLTIRASVPKMRSGGGGVIINTGSEAGLGMPFNSAYSAAKEGLAGLTRSIARELGRFHIRCNLIRPRATAGKTGGGEWFQQKLQGEWQPLLAALGPHWIGKRGMAGWDRPAPPESIAALVTWLCTDAARNVNGQDFYVGGDEIALLTPPEFQSAIFRRGGWSLEALQESGATLTGSLTDTFKVPNPLTTDD
jgi:NAD(P)-dependent dehydrogenase (short-subunit alcohol dehydrogenase family)